MRVCADTQTCSCCAKKRDPPSNWLVDFCWVIRRPHRTHCHRKPIVILMFRVRSQIALDYILKMIQNALNIKFVVSLSSIIAFFLADGVTGAEQLLINNMNTNYFRLISKSNHTCDVWRLLKTVIYVVP